MGARRHEQAGHLPPPPVEMSQSVLCISSYCKTLSGRIIYVLFSQPVVSLWGLDPTVNPFLDPTWGLSFRPIICPPLEKILRAPMLFPLPLFLPFFFISLSFLAVPFLSFTPFHTFAFSISRFLPEIQLGSLGSTVSSPGGPGRSQLKKQFLVHSEL